MKKLLSLLVISILVLSMAGCQNNGVTAKFAEDLKWDEETGAYENEKNAELVLWADNDAWAEKVLALWNEKYPDVTLTYESVNPTDAAEKIKLDGPAGLGADVFYIPHNSIVDLREAGALFELADRDMKAIQSSIQESAYKVTMYEGKMYAVPSSVENIALAYNKQILAAIPALESVIDSGAANLLEQIEGKSIYLEELFAGFADMGNSFAGTGAEIPFMEDRFYVAEAEGELGSEDIHTLIAWQLYDAYHNYPFLTRDGYRVFGQDNNDPSKFDIDSASVTSSIKAVTGDWYGTKESSRLFPGLATIEDVGWDQGPARFQKGQLAMTVSGPWVMGGILENWSTWIEEGKFGITGDTKVSDIFGVVNLPSFDNGSNPVTFSGVQVTGMNIYSKYPNAAMNLMNFLVSDDVMKEIYTTWGKIPAVADSAKIPGLNEDAIAQGFLSQAAFSHPMPVIQEGNYMWDPLRDVWTNVFNEMMTPEDAQKKSLEDYQQILVDSGSVEE